MKKGETGVGLPDVLAPVSFSGSGMAVPATLLVGCTRCFCKLGWFGSSMLRHANFVSGSVTGTS